MADQNTIDKVKKQVKKMILLESPWDFEYYSYDWGTLYVYNMRPMFQHGAAYMPFIIEGIYIEFGFDSGRTCY